MERDCVLVFSKPPSPGRVKTRLIGELSAVQAADLHRAFLEDTITGLSNGPFEVWMSWALEEGEEPPDKPRGLRAVRQVGNDLGDRLHHGLSLAGESFERVAAVGSDSPHLSSETVESAFEVLKRGADVAIGPASDGGFYLIAWRSRALRPEVFAEIPWSSGQELAAIVDRCRRFALSVAEIEEVSDVDEPSDLEILIALLERGEAACPATRQVLRRWGRLSS